MALGTNSKVANTRAVRFLATAETSGFDTALEELKGKPVIKSGSDPTDHAAIRKDLVHAPTWIYEIGS